MVAKPKHPLVKTDLAAKNCNLLELHFHASVAHTSFGELFPSYKKHLKSKGRYQGSELYKKKRRQHMLVVTLEDIDLPDKDSVSFEARIIVSLLAESTQAKLPDSLSPEGFYQLFALLEDHTEKHLVDISAEFTYPKKQYSGLGFPILIASGPPSFEVLGARFRIKDPRKGTYTMIIDTTPEGDTWHHLSLKTKMNVTAGIVPDALRVISALSGTAISIK